MENKEECRPVEKGEKQILNQYVYIGIVGIKSYGKPVVMDGVPYES